jgi:aspartyl-tRNA(Asn)/glutamyl-tRNA(Gln) amidotransferase subunit A
MSDLTTEPMPMSEQPGSAPVDASMMLPQVHEWTISSAGEALRNGSITSVELLQQCLALADAYDDTFGVFITRTTEAALERAAAADAELADGIDRGPLHGIPLAVKDILSTADAPTTAQSLILDPQWGVDQGDAEVVSRLRAGGAVLVGKTATLEFAIGFADPEKPFPIHRNPWNAERWPGGSSAGSGAGVAAGMCLGAIGTDTGGSIRIPAAFCGISGLKATYGRVPGRGCVPLGYSLDHIGPMARSAADCAAMFGSMADWRAEEPAFGADDLRTDLEGITIGVDRVHHPAPDSPAAVNVDPTSVEAFEQSLVDLEALGATIKEIELPLFAEASMADIVIMVCEAMSYHRMDFQQRWTEYGTQTRRVLGWSIAFSAADYVQAQRVRRATGRRLAAMFDQGGLDAIVHPTSLFGAPVVDGAGIEDWFDWPIFTGYGNSVGLPVLSVPMGLSSDEMPVGLSVMTAAHDEFGALGIGNAYQCGTGHHELLPPL